MNFILIGFIVLGIAGIVIEIMKRDLVHQQEIQQIKNKEAS